MGEDQGAATMARPTAVGNVTTTAHKGLSGNANIENRAIYEFAKMSAVDWDKVYEGHMNQLQFISWNGLNIGRLTLAIWILASHMALILLILCKVELRRQPKNILIINVSLTNLLMGIFLIPAKLHFILGSGDLEGDCGLSMGWAFLNDYYQVCVALLAVFGLVLERLVYVYTERRGTFLTRFATWLNCTFYFLLPWVMATVLLMPVFYEAIVEPVPGQHCAYWVHEHYFLVMEIISFLPAGLAVFITAPLAGLLDCLRSDKCTYTPSTPRGESLVIAVLVSVLTVFCEAPYFITRMLIMCMECSNPFCSRFNEGLTAGMWLRIAKASVMPFMWLVYSDMRAALLCRFNYTKVKSSGSEEDEDDHHLVNTRM